MFRKSYRSIYLSVFVVASLAFGRPATADSVTGVFFYDQTNLLSDNSGEYLQNNVGPINIINVGDVIIGTLQMSTNEDLTGGGGTAIFGASAWTSEFTAVFALQVVSKSGTGPFSFTFGPANDPLGLGWQSNTIVATYSDSANDYTRLGASLTDALDSASSGDAFWEFGFTGAAGEGFSASASSDDISVVSPIPGAFGLFNGGLSVTATNSAPSEIGFAPIPTIFGGDADISLSGSLLGTGGANTPFDIFNNTDVAFRPFVIPEPGSMSIWGLAVVGAIGYGAWRRRRASRIHQVSAAP